MRYDGWLAFELNVLRRLNFSSIALPFAGEPMLSLYLKRRGVRVAANDILQQYWAKSVANVQNNQEVLTEENVALVLEDAYVPRHKLYNPALRNWFGETDAWWFDNVRDHIEQIEIFTTRAIALEIAMAVGDYVLSFDQETLELRQPLSQVYRRLWHSRPAPIHNSQNNTATNKEAREFLAELHADTVFFRLPPLRNTVLRQALGQAAWREEWTRGNGDFWDALERQQAGRLGTRAATKFQYLELVVGFLETASHLDQWIISHVEDGFVSAAELIEAINRVRRVQTVYSKDFTELTGARAVIITA